MLAIENVMKPTMDIQNSAMFAFAGGIPKAANSAAPAFQETLQKAMSVIDKSSGLEHKQVSDRDYVKFLTRLILIRMDRSSLALTGSINPPNSAILRDTLRATQNMIPAVQIPGEPEGAPKTHDHAATPAPESNSEPPFRSIIQKAASAYGLGPELIETVIQVESNYDAGAVSQAGAQGLMQLMPATAEELGVSDPFDPEQNIMGGSRYLKQLLNRYDGNLKLALAAYNWGPGNLERHSDKLPEETRNYVSKVTGILDSPTA